MGHIARVSNSAVYYNFENSHFGLSSDRAGDRLREAAARAVCGWPEDAVLDSWRPWRQHLGRMSIVLLSHITGPKSPAIR